MPNYSRWQDIPLNVLRGFIEELRLLHTDRGVAKIAGLSRSAVRDFAMGRTQPERRTLRAFGELYLQLADVLTRRCRRFGRGQHQCRP